MKHVYVAHPLMAPHRDGIEQNRRNASKWVAWAAHQGVAPMAMWIVLSGEWAETPENRERGLQIDEAQVGNCDEIWLCGGRVSSGMERERERARQRGIPVVDLTHLGAFPPACALCEEWIPADGAIGTCGRCIAERQ